jgi:hypothetical protein
MNWRIGFAATGIAAVLCAAAAWRTSRAVVDVGFWYDDFPFTFTESVTSVLGGPLSPEEIDAIKRISHAELARAYAGLRVTFSDDRRSSRTIRVRRTLERRRGQKVPNAGETFAMGPIGARSEVDFIEVVMAAIAFAPAGTTRQDLIEGIGRGIGRVAAHELGHAILGAGGAMDNRSDAESYEYFTHNRPAQYYGELHWAQAWLVLRERFGT